MATPAHVVSHTHWDRAWYLPFQRFRVHLVDLVDGVLDLLERDPAFASFTLDGQMALLDDYLAVRPGNRARIERLVRARRLEVGPWFVLPDAFLPSGEALIRNLQLGLAKARSLGADPVDGYMPDSFGHIEQMPQILRGFGLRSFLFMRGLDAASWERLGCEFTWRSPDGSEVLAIYLRASYLDASALGLPDAFGDFEGLTPEVAPAVDRIRSSLATRLGRAASGVHLLLNGCDHMPVQPELPALLDAVRRALPDVELVHGSLRGYVDAVLSSAAGRGVREGDLLGNAHHPVLSNVWSTRVDLKQANARAQWGLEQVAEPLCAAAGARGTALLPLVDEAWRLLLLNHAHDDLCGCSVDAVHRDDVLRFREVDEIVEEVASECVRALGRREGMVQQAGTAWLAVLRPAHELAERAVEADVFFPAAKVPDTGDANALHAPATAGAAAPRSVALFDPDGREVPVQVLARDADAFRALRCDTGAGTRFRIAFRLPPGGAPTLSWWRVAARAETASGPDHPVDGHQLGNATWRIEVRDDGRVDLLHRPTGTALRDALAFESGFDAGDTYSHGPVPGAPVLSTRGLRPVAFRRVARGPVFDAVEATWHLRRPRSLTDRRPVDLPITLRIRLPAGEADPELQVDVDHVVEDHRLRLCIATDGAADHAFAGGAFTVTRRARVPADLPEPEPGYPGERVYPTQFSRDFVLVPGRRGDVAVGHRGLHEYELLDGPDGRTDVAVTVLRAVGMLSRGDGRWRRVQAGPSLPTPDAQCPGRQIADLAIAVLPPGGDPAGAAARLRGFVGPVWVRQARLVPHGGGRAPAPGARPLLEVDDPLVEVSACRPGPGGDDLVVRLANRSAAPRRVRIAPGSAMLRERGVARAALADLDGSPREALDVHDGGATVALGPFQFRTLLFTLSPP